MTVLKTVIFALFFLCTEGVFAQQKSMPADPKTIKLFFEKTYLQTDRIYYSTGEDIWFSAYLVNAKSTSLTSTSNNLYVELINPNATIAVRRLIRMTEGLGNGDFRLADTLQTGWYQLRAYTNWMRNFGDDFVFKKQIYISNSKPEGGANAVKKTPKAENSASLVSKKTISFFPEGGYLIEGLTALVAFKTNDDFGNGLRTTGSIISSLGDTVTTFQSTEMGIGLFAFTPATNETYRVEGFYNKERFTSSLPIALKTGFGIHVTTDSLNIRATISTNETTFKELQDKPISIVIKHAGDNVYTGNLTLTKPTALVTIPTKDLPAGVAVLTLLDQFGRPTSERLIFLQSVNKVNLSVNSDKQIYNAREKVTVNIKATDALGQPLKTNLSLAAIDGELPNDGDNIVSYLMLRSEIKGEIKNAGQYFDPQNAGRFKQLDLLLLTQGWRAYLWRKLADSAINISYAPEPGITIAGKVTEKLGNKPLADMNITLFGSNFVGNKLYATKTDAAGRYFLDGLNWSGNQAVKLSSQDKGGKKGGLLQIDTLFKPFPVSLGKTQPAPINFSANWSTEMDNRMAYNRKYKIGDSILLDEVSVIGKKRSTVNLFDETLSTFGYPDQVFNITAADYTFKGLEHFLLTKANGARPVPDEDSTGVEGIVFNKAGRPRIIVNNRQDIQDRLDYYSLTMDQINKIVIRHLIDSKTANDVYVMELDLKESALRGPNLHLLNINLNGYYAAKAFYSPNYSSTTQTSLRDLRTTVFWAPLLKTNEKGEVSVSYFNADNKGNIVIKTDGITAQGTAVTAKANYKVQ